MDLMKSKYLRIITTWALKYFSDYDKAPNDSIMSIFKAERKNIQNEDDIDLIEDTLETINEKYIENEQKFDHNYIFQQVTLYIKGRSLEENADMVKGLVSQGKIQEAERVQKDYKRKEKNDLAGTNAFTDTNAITEMFQEDASLINIPNALGELIQEIYKGDLIWIGSNSKRGKTWCALQLAIYCAQQGLKVAFFTLEMSTRLINRRLAQATLGRSFKKVEGQRYIPEFDKNGNIIYKKHYIKQLAEKDVKRTYRIMNRQCNGGGIWFFDSTTGARSVDAMKNTIINSSTYDDLDFDVAFIDQISLISGAKGKEKRFQLDDTAIRLKTEICEDMGIPVFSPIQYSKQALKIGGGEDTIAEAYSLFHHASLLISLNQTDEEKARGIMRIGCSGRNNDYSGEIVLLQNLTMGRFILDSRWKRDIPNYNDILCNEVFTEEDEDDLQDL